MELHQLRYFLAVAKYRSFTRAAEEINVSQSSISTQVSKLESELGARLLERGARSVTLTAAGKEFIAYAADICEKEEKSRETMKQYGAPDKGLLRLGVFPGAERYEFFLQLNCFRQDFPRVAIDFYEAEGTVLVDMLVNGEIDAAFCGRPDVREGAVFHYLYHDRMSLIVPPGHRLAGRGSVSVADLNGETFILSEIGSLYMTAVEMIKEYFEERGAPSDVRFLACHNTSLLTNMGLVACGFGLSMCSAKAAENYRAIGCVALDFTPEIPREFGLAVVGKSMKQPFIRNFVNYFINGVGNRGRQ